MPAKTAPMTGFQANGLAAADHFIACRGSKPATRNQITTAYQDVTSRPQGRLLAFPTAGQWGHGIDRGFA
jgi:hypothetical protein